MKMNERIEQLMQRREQYRQMGGPERVERQHKRGKLDVRARIDKLFDKGTFQEHGLLAGDRGLLASEMKTLAPADGVVTGIGMVNGRPVACAAYDFTVFGGSIGEIGERKVTRLREQALKRRIPMVWLIDSAGARINTDTMDPQHMSTSISRFADTGYLFREEVAMSGVIPLVSAMMGPGAAGTAYIPGLADFVPMVKGTSSIAIGGPYLVEGVVGEKISEEDLGGSRIHTEVSGVADLEVPNDDECIDTVRQYLSYFPSHCMEKPPRITPVPPPEGAGEKLDKILPESSRQAYDMRKVITNLVDGGRFLEIKPRWARNIITALARIDGWSVGIVANNPMHLGGILDVDSSDKAARFINLCDAYSIPLLFLADVPGFMVGSKVEQQGIIRHGAKMLYAVATATVPKITVVVRKSYGAGYYVMCGRAYEPDLIVGWPTTEIAVMGAEGMVSIGAHKILEAAENKAEMKKQLAENIRPAIDPYRVAALAMIDDIIAPHETRAVVAHALATTVNKTVERPPRRREITPV
ncbi:MAG: acyl-CoA carboxylase subunit beta [Myxococcota bacterium]